MFRFLVVSFLFLGIQSQIYAGFSYSLKNELTLDEIAFIQSLTKNAPIGGDFYTPNGFNLNLLTDSQRVLLIRHLRDFGLNIKPDLFKSSGIYGISLREHIEILNEKTALLRDEVEKHYNDADVGLWSPLSLDQSLELAFNTVVNTGSLLADLTGTGLFLKMHNAINKIDAIHKIVTLEKNTEKYLKLIAMLKTLDLRTYKVLVALIQARFVINDGIEEEFKTTEVASKLTQIGLGFLLNKNIGKLTNKEMTYASGVFVESFLGSITEFSKGLIGLAIDDKNSDEAKFIREILKGLSTLVPVGGPLFSQYNTANEIYAKAAAAEAQSPEIIAAYKAYVASGEVLREEVYKARNEIISNQLEAILSHTNSIDIDFFPDVPISTRGFKQIQTLKELGIVSGKMIQYDWRHKQLEFRPNDNITIGEFLTMVAGITYIENKATNIATLGCVNHSLCKKYLEDQGYLLDISDTELLTDAHLNQPATRGYIAKILYNIGMVQLNKAGKQYQHKVSEKYPVVLKSPVEASCQELTEENENKQVTSCKVMPKPSFYDIFNLNWEWEWDECSFYIRSLNYTSRTFTYGAHDNATRYEVALMLYAKYSLSSAESVCGTLTYSQIQEDAR